MNNCNKISPTNNQERRSIVKSIVKRVVDIVAHCVAELLGIKRSEEKLEYATNITHRDQNRGFFKAEIQEAGKPTLTVTVHSLSSLLARCRGK